MYWVLDKHDETPYIFSSIKALSEKTGVSTHTLYYQFGKLKRNEYNTNNYRVVVLNPISSKRLKS